MTLFDVVALTAIAVFIVLFAGAIAQLFHLDPWVAGWALSIATVAAWVLNNVYLRRTFFPKCETGKCGATDYQYVGGDPQLGLDKAGIVYRCRCGKSYLHNGTAFYAVGDQNRTKHYKTRRHKYARWVDPGKFNTH